MNFLKRLAVFASLNVLIFSNTACTKENTETKVDAKATTTLASNTATEQLLPKVSTIVEVDPATKNKVVDFTYNDNGKKVKFSELTKGKVVFINFWGTWCPPCRRELPDIVEIYKELKDKDFIVIGIALERDPSTAVATVSSFAQKNNLYYPLFIGSQELVSAYGGVEAVPTTFIIDRQGNISETIVGMKDKAGFMAAIKKVL